MRSSSGRAESSVSDIIDLGHLAAHDSRQADYSGSHGLLLAVLEEGIRSFLTGKGRIRDEAEFWIFKTGAPRSLFSFPMVCEHLGLDPGATRNALRELSLKTCGKGAARSRPNVSRSRRVLG